jgi:hypothetical protein
MSDYWPLKGSAPRRWFSYLRRMVSSGLLRLVALVRPDVSEEPGASFIRVTKIGELVKRATRRNNPEDTILHSHRRENLKSYIVTYGL